MLHTPAHHNAVNPAAQFTVQLVRRRDLRVIPAKHVRAGMTMAFVNERFNYVVDDVSFDRDDEVRIDHGDFTAVEWFPMDQNVWVLQ